MKALTACMLAAVVLVPVSAVAIDHKNLDEGRPLRLEDAYAISTGESAVEVGAGFTLQRRGPNRGGNDSVDKLSGAAEAALGEHLALV